MLNACEKVSRLGGDTRTLDLGSDTVKLPAGAALHEVSVRAVQGGDFTPAQTTARHSDFVRFTINDTRTHALIIEGPNAQADSILDATTQRRSPPLVAKGQAWVISMKALPAGSYRISCASHAGTATLVVQ